jgi:hypothetical protein
MDRVAVESTILAWVEYSPERRLLKLGFHGGKVYDYFDVPLQTYAELLRAPSQGNYFNFNIRNHFAAREVHVLASGQ